jgi:hypothetical protein
MTPVIVNTITGPKSYDVEFPLYRKFTFGDDLHFCKWLDSKTCVTAEMFSDDEEGVYNQINVSQNEITEGILLCGPPQGGSEITADEFNERFAEVMGKIMASVNSP